MPKGIVIPVLESEPMYIREFDSLNDYQVVIGGYIEPVDLTVPNPATMYVDEEGLLKQKEGNARATLLLMLHNPAYLFTGALIVGTTVIVGPPDDEGDTLNVPDYFATLLIETHEYKVEVQTADDPYAWNGNQRRFERWEEAAEHGISLARRWMAVERVRVVAA